ncbi:MAG: AI-2E family transporter [Patescibacteria group bacterium]
MNDRGTIIHISAGTIWKGILIVALAWAIFLLRDLALILITSVVIASAIEPAARWFAHYRVPRIPSVIAVYLAVIILVAGIFYLLIPSLISEVAQLPEIVTARLSDISTATTDISFDVSGKSASDIVDNISSILPVGDVLKNINTVIGVPAGAFRAASAVFGGVFQMLLIIIISFYLSVQERGIENFLRIVTPAREEGYVIDLWRRSQAKIGKWMQGQLMLGVFVGVLVYLGLTVLGVKYALSLALLAMIAEIIPIFGPIIAAVPAVILGFLESIPLGLMVLGLYVIIQQFENHLIYPLVVRKVIGVHPLIVIISLLIGGQLAGFLGILLAVPVAAVVLEFTDDVQKKKHIARESASA